MLVGPCAVLRLRPRQKVFGCFGTGGSVLLVKLIHHCFWLTRSPSFAFQSRNIQTTIPPTLRTPVKRQLEPEGLISSPGSAKTARATTSTPRRNKKRLRDAAVPVTPEPEPVVSATSAKSSPFRDLKVAPQELRCSATLTTGQSFSWKDITPRKESKDEEAEERKERSSAWGTHNAQEWIGTVRVSETGDTLVLHVKETTTTTLYKVIHHHKNDEQKGAHPTPNKDFYDNLLRAYFQLHEPLQPLYKEWSTQCTRMNEIAQSIPGARVLQQDPWETLISFICSSNNNIPRITSMLQSIRKTYGHKMDVVDTTTYTEDDSDGDSSFYTFPTPQELSEATEKELRTKCGLGYRAKYIVQTTKTILEWGGEEALFKLRGADYETVRARLIELDGVGPKVADCVALFSLDQDTHAIPVDVHVWNICLRDYAHQHEEEENVSLTSAKSVTPVLYKRVQDIFVKQFPNKTGWAHSLLFVAELPSFRPTLPEHVLKEMEEFKKQEQEKKKRHKKKG